MAVNKKAQDPDIVATSLNLSLKCPIAGGRISVPCRGTSCKHISCFDTLSYLLLQEQGPQWSCPICYKPAPYEQLAVDEYVKDILQKTSDNTESVRVEPDGQWGATRAGHQASKASSFNSNSADDEDDLEISEIVDLNGKRNVSTPAKASGTSTPLGQRGASSSARPTAGQSSAKRAAPVIDLTLSSDEDEDEEPARPTKRQNTGNRPMASINTADGYPYLDQVTTWAP